MSTSNQQTLAESGASDRPPILEKGSYVPWASWFLWFPNNKQEEGERMRRSIDSGPYERKTISNRDNPPKEMLEPIRKRTEANKKNILQISKLMNEFDKFVAVEGESLTSIYERLTTLINVMDRHKVRPIPISINTKFLNSLQPEWSKYVTMTRQNYNLKEVDYDVLFDTLSQLEPYVNASKVKKAARNHDPLALVAHSNVHSSQSYASPSYSHSP
ncbi:hypothetical protein Tco_0456234 [Tanacetum coccineum]